MRVAHQSKYDEAANPRAQIQPSRPGCSDQS
jgi:hypothetical protein